jgi:hypothetical protein
LGVRGDKHALGWHGGAIEYCFIGVEMQLILKLDVVDGGQLVEGTEIWRCEDVGASLSPGHLGLSLADGKTICAGLQQAVAERQVACLTASGTYCPHCGLVMRVKDYRRRRIDTVYGRIDVKVPRRFCVACRSKPAAPALPVSGRSTAEYDWIRAKLAAHLPYRAAGDVLNVCLPIAGGANHTSVRRHTAAIAKRMEATAKRIAMPPKPVPMAMTVALDTGYVRATPSTGSRQIEILIGNNASGSRRLNVFAAVAAAGASWPDHMRSRLEAAGYWPGLTEVTVFTDGANGLRSLARVVLGPKCQPILDWFHLAMRLRHIEQTACSLTSHVKSHAVAKAKIQAELRRLHWRLWHGKPDAVQQAIDRLRPSLRAYKFHHRRRDILATPRKVSTLLHRLKQYVNGQSGWLIDYSRRQRAGQRVSTSTAESAVNVVIDQRMNRRNQMRWSARGAHDLLQVRTAVLNGTFDRSLDGAMHGNTALASAHLPIAKAA